MHTKGHMDAAAGMYAHTYTNKPTYTNTHQWTLFTLIQGQGWIRFHTTTKKKSARLTENRTCGVQ